MIAIDYREKDIINLCNSQLNGRELIITTENLALGDIKIGKLLIERKTINDLAASIVDGRYKEQSFRLLKALEEGYKIFYFIEGNMDLYTGAISKNTLISTIYSLTHKGFQVLLTKNSKETSLFILQFAEKMKKESIEKESELKTYENTEGIIQTKKNKNITRENISTFMLCQIPGISTTTACILLEKYGHISKLIMAMNSNPNEIEEFVYNSNSKTQSKTQSKTDFKSKHLNKNIITNLNNFLKSE